MDYYYFLVGGNASCAWIRKVQVAKQDTVVEK
ncbi:MAG: hypothetical protein AVDCRST_MAG93-3403 [uncultured Chloroflexia bacterium]|uniref:Uncharacterized protein n=1 Tax=uncultured Chloroflexia bacterium TaxID=1672391 RepID=A0A6J4JPU9_9CHLR|nr:MAG: hypothetical protein AVDCRST_MAG93-3403 [uncultured Chloroflexia bacterium]